ncbi:MAG: CHAD domain-containing protein [Bacteroidales bacterium]
MATPKKSTRKPAKTIKKARKSKAVKKPKSPKKAKPVKKVKAKPVKKAKAGRIELPNKNTPILIQLKPEEPLGIGIRRLLTDELYKVSCFTDQPVEGLHTSIHEIRRILKRVRAVIWLMEPDIGSYNCQRESAVYRDIGRRISGLRSLYVNQMTLQKLSAEFPKKLVEGPLKRTGQLLEEKYKTELKKALEEQNLIHYLKQDIDQALAGTEEMQVLHDDLSIPEHALRMAFKTGRKRWRKVARKANSINIHELRKEVKNLQFQLQLLELYDPKGIHRRIEPLHRLAQLAGLEHDHYELAVFIRKYLPQEELKKELLFRMNRKMVAIRKQILPLARKVYGMKSKKFIAGIKLSTPGGEQIQPVEQPQ